MQDFLISGVDLANFRFRAYDNIAKIKMQVYDQFDKNLIQHQLRGYSRLVIEIKKPEEEFEIYNPDLVTLKTIKYVEGEKYDFKRIDSLPTQSIIINKKEMSVAELEHILAEMYGIPEDRLIILLRHISYNNSIKGEIYNMGWRKPKKIEDSFKLEQGVILYIEEGDIKDKMESFKWNQEFMKELDKLVLNINDPTVDPTGSVFAVRLEMKKHNTLLELKERIGEMFNLKIGDFAIKRFMV
jgi:hypothetical protein